jgi:hypothetical protein
VYSEVSIRICAISDFVGSDVLLASSGIMLLRSEIADELIPIRRNDATSD